MQNELRKINITEDKLGGSLFRNLQELWGFRALIFSLVERHLRARYRGSALGFIWSFLNPLCLILVYALVFKYYMRFDQQKNYALYIFSGLLPWIWFSSSLVESTGSISSSGSLITKAMFPPQILPFVSILTNLCHFIFAVPIIIIYMLMVGVTPSIGALLFFPIVVFSQLTFLFGVSLILATFNVFYRDIQHILGNFITFLFFLCPIVYPIETIPERFRFTYLLNPVAWYTKFYQDIFYYAQVPQFKYVFVSLLVGLVFLIIGSFVFNEKREILAELV